MTLNFVKDCQLHVKQVNPRQYVAEIPQVSPLLDMYIHIFQMN